MKRILVLLAAAALALPMVSCDRPNGGVRGVKHVILIGLDGMAANTFAAADMPTLRSMMEQGAWTLHSRSILPSSSACNWASMFMGVGPEMHGYNTWGSSKPDFPSIEIGPYGIFPTIAGVLRAHDPEIRMSAMYEWATIGSLIEGEALDVSRNIPYDESHSEAITTEFINCLDSLRPAFSMVIYDSPDHDGHGSGWGSPQYLTALHLLDGYIASIVEATKRMGIYDDTVFIVTADHGGTGTGHGGTSMDEMETPLVLFGKGVKRGHEITSAVMRYDTAPTIAYIFGAACPDVWRGKPVREAFE
ncbi:MAG: alkaline phosphatase [Alistipes sp.]|nr:alkaline phosphatase [Alistipes sp.]